MKKNVISLLLALSVSAILVSCNHPNGEETTAESYSEQTSDSAGTEEIASSVSEYVSSSESESDSVDSEEKEEKKKPVILPEGQELAGSYHTTEGISLEAGSYIAVVAKDLSSGYWKTVKEGAMQAIDDLNQQLGYSGSDKIRFTFEGPSEEGNVDQQINTIDSVITENPDALILSIVDMQSCVAQIELARENGIPVLIIDSGMACDSDVMMIATDNVAAGREAANHLADALNGQGKVLVVAHQENTQTSKERVKGFTEEMEQRASILMEDVLYESAEQSVEDQLRAALEKYPGIGGIFCTNENMSVETLKALETIKTNREIRVIGFDSGDVQIKAVLDGHEVGLISQNPYAQGYATVIAAARSISGLEVDKFVDTGFVYLDADTIEAEENQKYLYR